jgi:hypothetical protein
VLQPLFEDFTKNPMLAFLIVNAAYDQENIH